MNIIKDNTKFNLEEIKVKCPYCESIITYNIYDLIQNNVLKCPCCNHFNYLYYDTKFEDGHKL